MNSHAISLLAMVMALADTARGDSTAGLRIEAERARATVESTPADRGPLHLPTLAYSITIAARCDTGLDLDSVSVSIADTRRTMRRDAFADGAATTIELTVPARQLAPLTVDRFCRDLPESEPSNLHLEVDGVATATASLYCRGSERESITYTSSPLGVALQCAAAQSDSDSATR